MIPSGLPSSKGVMFSVLLNLEANVTANVILLRKNSHFGNLGSAGLLEKGACVHYL